MDKRKYFILLAVVLIVVFIICAIVYKDQDLWEKVDSDWSFDYPENIEYQVDCIEEEKSYIIEGYAFIHNEILYTIDMTVVLRDKEDDVYYKIKTDVNNLGDLTDSFNEGINYDNSRFVARAQKKHLKNGHTYEIGLLYRNNGYNFLIPMDKGVNENGE